MSSSSGTRLRAPAVVAAALFTLLLGLLGVAPAQAGVGNNPTSQTWKVLVGEESPDMAIQGMRFLPGEIWIHQTDSIRFLSNSAEIHTVSYGKPPLPPTSVANLEADAFTPVGGPVFNPKAAWTNSGVIAPPAPGLPTIQAYQLKFAVPGDFTFYCIVHGEMMNIVVHVLHRKTELPHDQGYYDRLARVQSRHIIDDGYDLMDQTMDRSSSTHVYVGAMDDQAMVMRFMPSLDRIEAGTTVTFDMSANEGVVPHTVTFTDLKKSDGKPVDSGTLLPKFAGGPSTFTWKFDQTGTWHYICEFHDEMGMVGDISVTP
jgi:plastocyanin